MEKAKILMLCSHKDTPRIQRLMDTLKELGIHAELPEDSLMSGKPFAEQIASLITHAKIIVFFISEHSINSEYLTKEILLRIINLLRSMILRQRFIPNTSPLITANRNLTRRYSSIWRLLFA